MRSCTSSVLTRLAAVIAASSVVACSEGNNNPTQIGSPVTLGDGAIIDAPGEEVGDGWVTGEAGSSDAPDSGAAPVCFPEPTTTVSTYVPSLTGIEIDPSANLLNDPALPSADWEDVTADANHRILDDDTLKGSGFPGSNSCLNADGKTVNNPPKDDILQVGLASNNTNVFLNVLRASGEGDMGYGILVTQERPLCANKDAGVGGAACNGRFFKFKFSPNDVLIWGHFRTGSTELLAVHPFVGTAGEEVSAQNAIIFHDADRWGSSVPGVLVAVNESAIAKTTNSADWFPSGINSFADRTFAEGSVPLSVFGSNVCGKTLWMTVISNSEGNDPENGDVKDLLSPKRVNFGALSATANVKPNCDGTVDLQATVTGAGGTASCEWFVNGVSKITSANCDYIQGLDLGTGAGPFSIHVVVSDPNGTGCNATSPAVSINKPAGIVLNNITASTAAACSATAPNTDVSEVVRYRAEPTSSSAAVTTYVWESCLPGGTSCSAITCLTPETGDEAYDCRYAVPANEGNCAQRLIKVTADDGTGNCPAVSKSRVVTRTTTTVTSDP